MQRAVIVICIWLIVCALGTSVFAEPYIAFYEDAGFTDTYLNGTGLVNVYLVVQSVVPTTAVQFWAPIPDCWPATHLYESSDYLVIGDSQTGVTIAYGTCLSAPVHVMTISVWVAGGPEEGTCCRFASLPDPAAPSGKVEFVDCNFAKVLGLNSYAMISEPGAVPPTVGSPSPPDGSTSQALNTQLSWDSWSCSDYPRTHSVYFGTSADPPMVAFDYGQNTYDPGLLIPNTTYYWKIEVFHLGPGGSVMSPVWSFTTEDDVPTQNSTWGTIKALFK